MFLGPAFQFEDVISYDTIPNSYHVVQGSEKLIALQNRIKGKRLGLGLSFTSDTRDNIINPSTGHFLQLSFLTHFKLFGSDYEYSSSRIENHKIH